MNKFKRHSDVTYVNYHDDFNYHMDRLQFKRWFKKIGAPNEFKFDYDNSGNDVWNEASMTLQKHTNYEFSIVSNGHHKCLVSKMHIRDNDTVKKELEKKYSLWINQVLKENKSQKV